MFYCSALDCAICTHPSGEVDSANDETDNGAFTKRITQHTGEKRRWTAEAFVRYFYSVTNADSRILGG
ncbi:hypothetical protein HCJ66_10365 [Listeria sp. FSL L7-1582]|nr:hypothetical protein [Listeria portnoyi]